MLRNSAFCALCKPRKRDHAAVLCTQRVVSTHGAGHRRVCIKWRCDAVYPSAGGDRHEERCLIWSFSLCLLLYFHDTITVTQEDHGAPLAILRENFRGLLAGESACDLPRMDDWSVLVATWDHVAAAGSGHGGVHDQDWLLRQVCTFTTCSAVPLRPAVFPDPFLHGQGNGDRGRAT